MLTVSTSKRQRSIKSSYHHGDLNNILIVQAIKIIKKSGISTLNLRDLANKCGVSATAVYRHFKSKDHLLASIAAEGFEVYINAILTAQKNETEIPRKLQQIGIAYISFAVEHPVHFQLMYGTYLDREKFPDLLKKGGEAYHIFHSQFENAVKLGMMTSNLENITRTAWATVHGTALLLLDNQFSRVENEIVDYQQIAYDVTLVLGMGLFKTPLPAL